MAERRIFPAPPRVHGLSSTTFTAPTIDGSSTIPEICDWIAEHSPHHRAYTYVDDNGQIKSISWLEAGHAIHVAARIVRDRVGWSPGMASTPVIAILAQSGKYPRTDMSRPDLTAACQMLSRTPPPFWELCGQTLPHSLFPPVIRLQQEQSTQDLMKNALEILRDQYPSATAPTPSLMPVFEELYITNSESNFATDDLSFEFKGPDTPCVPGFNKVFGLGIDEIRRRIAGCFWRGVRLSGAQFSTTYPYPGADVQYWSRNEDCVKWLSTRPLVTTGGGPLDQERGDYLASQGVRIWNAYGITEVGAVSTFFPATFLPEWEYFRITKNVTVKMVPNDGSTYEIVILSSEMNQPSVINTTVDGVPAYATSDLVVSHPQVAGYWKIIGRTDDQIMHSTGEKDVHVQACVMFGRGRFQAGILVDPKSEYRFDVSDETALADFRNKIWPTIEKMNEYAPQHSRIFKELILVSIPSKSFQFTTKGTARRGAILKEYEPEIAVAYEKVEQSEQLDILPPHSWDQDIMAQFIRSAVQNVIKYSLLDDDDIFQHGCDSLQATYIRNTILRALRDSAHIDTRQINVNFVYAHPTITRLVLFAVNALRGDSQDNSVATRVDEMHKIVAKYGEVFPVHRGSIAPVGGDVVLLTGSTGSLGCYILALLASDPGVSRVYALNRPSRNGVALRERQRLALTERELDAGIVETGKTVLLEGDMTLPNLGVPQTTYEEDNIQGLRHLIDLSLASPMIIPPRIIFTSSVGVLQSQLWSLLQFVVQYSPYTITDAQSDDELIEAPIKAEFAAGTGYAESKWVSEQVLYEAAAKTPLDPLIVRVGQLSGAPDGLWNAHEWYPAMVQSAPVLRCFPDDDRGVSWIPLDLAAAALVDFRRASNPAHTVHLVHPRPVSWHSIATQVVSEFSVPLVPYTYWLEQLEATARSSNHPDSDNADTLETLHASRLLRLFRSFAKEVGTYSERSAMGMPNIKATRAIQASNTLADPHLRQPRQNACYRLLIWSTRHNSLPFEYSASRDSEEYHIISSLDSTAPSLHDDSDQKLARASSDAALGSSATTGKIGYASFMSENMCDFGKCRLASLAYPFASREHLRTDCNLMSLFFVLDEYTVVESAPVVREMIDVVIDAVKNPSHTPRPQGRFCLEKLRKRHHVGAIIVHANVGRLHSSVNAINSVSTLRAKAAVMLPEAIFLITRDLHQWQTLRALRQMPSIRFNFP
ncbi:hypothetical protein WOLCODRAFT_17681 [Wolfiporia cocos MD-104 SS10]|uniref:Thioester reductase (TE) domain-containing protein n=1 Tax=Wolfiporia cocos (strain MD-104) TaxID=742152 RepID=A0A2H3JKJ3_WOLCO|nr:hypothetical protein WOLCODRAFT_17681 [Wolfiporia cocos MD-104 SS10]